MRVEAADRMTGRSALTFEGFYAEHLEVTAAVIVALRGPRVAADDLAQEAFERAYHRWDAVSGMERPDL